MTVSIGEMLKYVGTHGTIDAGGLTVEVQCVDAKAAYGHLRLLVSPVAGAGQVWVEEYRYKVSVCANGNQPST